MVIVSSIKPYYTITSSQGYGATGGKKSPQATDPTEETNKEGSGI